MQIHYRVYEEHFESGFAIQGVGIHRSSCRKFELALKSQPFGKYSEIFTTELHWKETTRPEVGFSLVKLQIPVQFSANGSGFAVFQHGYQSWSISRSRASGDEDRSPRLQFLQYSQENIYTVAKKKPGIFVSEGFVVLYSQELGRGILIGVKEKGAYGAKFEIVLSNLGEIQSVKAIFDIHSNPELRPSKPVVFPELVLTTFAGNPEKAMANYFKELGDQIGTPDLPKKIPVGWCSWYYYYTKINQKVILENLEKARELKLPLEFFQIDDGYQKEIGDWLTPNDKFPGGMRLLADEIKRAGFKPGIWLAPFLIRKKSEFFRKYPEAILKDENGDPVSAIYQPIWGSGYTYALDVTHPAALSFLEKVFKTFVKDWGYPYLKLDFLYAGLLPGETYKKNLSPQERYVEVMKMIRGIVGKSTFLLGCGAPIIPSIGFFDAMRVSCDVAPFFFPEKTRVFLQDRNAYCTRNALINNITRASMHRNFWINDPDCLLVRKKKNKMTIEQTQMMASVLAISGGMLLVSDDLTKLEPERFDLLLRALRLSSLCQNKTPLPVGLFQDEFPRALYNPAGFLGIWNPTESRTQIQLELPVSLKGDLVFRDYWTEQIWTAMLTNRGTELAIELDPYQSVVFSV